MPTYTATVSTLAGSGTATFADGTGTGASFNGVYGTAFDPSSGNTYIADANNNRIRKVTPGGVVTTIAGTSAFAFLDGTGTGARFEGPQSLVCDSAGNVYIADTYNCRIRKMTPGGVVTTIAGSGSVAYADGTGTGASFKYPQGITIDSSGTNLYVADSASNCIRKIVISTGVVTTLAGSTAVGSANGTGTAATFSAPCGLVCDSSGTNLYVADTNNNRIRQIVISTGVVTTLAGSSSGYVDDTGTLAKFQIPQSVGIDSSNNIIVADSGNNRIRQVTSAGVVTTIAGSGGGSFADGVGTGASFHTPNGVSVDSSGKIYVSDTANNRIRLITLTPVVDTTAPSVPTNLAVGTITTTSVALTWTASTDDTAVDHYEVLRDGATLAGSPTGVSFTDTGRTAGQQYSYQVRAADAAGNKSSYTAAINTTTPPVDLAAGTLGPPTWGGTTDNLLAVSYGATSPYLLAWTRSGNSLSPITLSTAMPSASNTAIAWSPDGQYLAIGLAATPHIWFYYYNGSTLTRINIAFTTAFTFSSFSWDPTSTYLVGTASNVLVTYTRTGSGSGATFAQTSTLLTAGVVSSIVWSPDGNTIAVGSTATSPYLFMYSVTAGVLNPIYAPLPAIPVTDLTWSPDSKSLALTSSSSPYLYFYYRDNVTGAFVQYSPSTTFPGSTALSVSWSKDGNYVAAGYAISPYVAVYLRTMTATGFTFTLQPAPAISLTGSANSLRYGKSNLAIASNSGFGPYLVLTAAPSPDITAPAAPTNLAYQSVVGQTVTLTWTASSSSDTTSYLIRRNGTVVANVAAYQTYFKDTPFIPATTYTYDIGAQDGAGNISWSSTVAVTTPAKSVVPTWSYQIKNVPFTPGAPYGNFQYVNGQFMTVNNSASGMVTTSSDGYTWSIAYSSVLATAGWGALAYGGGKYVALSNSIASCAYSTDGVIWTSGTSLGTVYGWASIAYGNGKFAAITGSSNGTTASYSADGITWTVSTTALPAPASGSFWRNVVFGNGVFVAIASTGTVAASSTDGITWTVRTLPASVNWQRVAYANGKFIATNATNTGAVSTDGTNWASLSFPSWSAPSYITADASTNTFYVKDTTYWTLSSTDGSTWTTRPTYSSINTPVLAAGGGALVYVTTSANIYNFYVLGNFTGQVNGGNGGNYHVNWSDDNTLAVGIFGPPSLAMFARSGNVITKVADPDILPILGATPITYSNAQATSPDGAYIAIGSTILPYLFLYYWNGTTLAKVSITPTFTPSVTSVTGLAWDATGTLLAVGTNVSPYVRIFQRTGTGTSATLTQISNPTLTGFNSPLGFTWYQPTSSSTQYLALTTTSSSFFAWYSITTSTGAVASTLTQPATLPSTAVNALAWSSSGDYLAVGTGVSPYIIVYYRSGSTLTKLTNTFSAVVGSAARSLSWNGNTLTVTTSATAPYYGQYTLSGSGVSATLTPVASPPGANTGFSYLYEAPHSPVSGTLVGVSDVTPIALPSVLVAPVVPTISSVTNSGSSVTVSWNTTSDTLYEVFRGGVSQGTTASTSFTQTVSDGTYSYTVRGQNSSGNWSTQSSSSNITVDTVAPTVPTIGSSVTGSSVSINWTNIGDAVLYEVFRGGVSQGTVSSTPFTQTVSDGTYSYTVRARDATGNYSAQSSSSGVTVDTTPPTIPTISSVTNSGLFVTVTWNSNGDVVIYEVFRGGVSQGTTSSTSLSQTVPADGTYSYSVRGRDAVGNWSAQSSGTSITVDTVPPTLSGVTASRTALGTSDRTVAISWTQGNDATQFQVRRNGVTVHTDSSSATTYNDTPPADNVYTYGVRVADSYNNFTSWTDASSVLVDTVPPTTPTVSTSSTATTKNVTVSWNTNSDVSVYQVYRGGSLLQDNVTGTSYNDTVPTDGSYTYTVRGKDTSNNWSGYGSSSITIDTTPPTVPNTPSLSVAAAPSRTVTATWNTNADVALYEIALDGTSQGTTTSTSYDILNVTDGTHTVSVRARDAALNWSSYSSTGTIIIDRTAPTSPNAPTSTRALGSRTVVLSWNVISDAVSYKVFRDGSQIATPTTNTYSDTVSSDSTYSYTIESVDASGNSSTVSSASSVVVDTSPPPVPTNPSVTGGNSISLTWSASSGASTYGVYRNGSQISSSSSTSFSETPADGTYTYTVTALDVYSNESAQSSGVTTTVDNTPPAVPTVTVSASTGSRVVTVAWDFISDAVAFEIKRNGTSLTITASGTSYHDTVPADGTFIYTVRAKDATGNWSSFSTGQQIVIDTLPPDVPTNIHGSATRYASLVLWDSNSDVSQYEISRNGTVVGNSVFASFADTLSGYGVYFYKVRAKDAAGNWSSYSTEIEIDSVDTDPPVTPTNLTITVVGNKRVSLGWDADSDVSSWEIYRNGTLLISRSTNSYVDDIPNFGTTTYKIRAKDLAGNYSGYTDNETVTFAANTPTIGRLPLNDITVNERPSDDESDFIRRFSRDDGDEFGGLLP